MDRFREMETFAAVVECGSFVQAAEKLRISKSVVSRMVQDLEGRLGGRLLHRTTRRLSITDTGQAYYQRCRQILDDIAEVENVVSMDSARVSGVLKVSAPLTFGTMHLAELWGDFMLRYPEVKMDVSLLDRRVDLVGEGYDMAIRIEPRPEDSSLMARKLASSRIVICAAPSYLEERGTPQSLDEMSGHEFIGYSYSPSGDILRASSQGHDAGLKLHPRLRVNNGDTCRAAALQGLGIIAAPTFIVGDDLRTGRLVEVLADWHIEERGVYAVYPSRQHLSGKVRALVDYLTEAFKGAGWNSMGG